MVITDIEDSGDSEVQNIITSILREYEDWIVDEVLLEQIQEELDKRLGWVRAMARIEEDQIIVEVLP